MDTSPETPRVSIHLRDLNQHLMCALCGGYLIDATTIIECLHSFCKTCIIRYLETSKYCPICDVQVHKTRPLDNVRSDKTLQTLVYKLVPGLFKNEMSRRKVFYAANQDGTEVNGGSSSCSSGIEPPMSPPSFPPHIHSPDVTPEEDISLCLQHCDRLPPFSYDESPDQPSDRRFLLCPSGLTIGLLKKFIKMKFDLPSQFQINIFHSVESLANSYTLMDIAHIYTWRRLEPLKLYYTVWDGRSLSNSIVPPSPEKIINTEQSIQTKSPKSKKRKLKDPGGSGLVAKKSKLEKIREKAKKLEMKLKKTKKVKKKKLKLKKKLEEENNGQEKDQSFQDKDIKSQGETPTKKVKDIKIKDKEKILKRKLKLIKKKEAKLMKKEERRSLEAKSKVETKVTNSPAEILTKENLLDCKQIKQSAMSKDPLDKTSVMRKANGISSEKNPDNKPLEKTVKKTSLENRVTSKCGENNKDVNDKTPNEKSTLSKDIPDVINSNQSELLKAVSLPCSVEHLPLESTKDEDEIKTRKDQRVSKTKEIIRKDTQGKVEIKPGHLSNAPKETEVVSDVKEGNETIDSDEEIPLAKLKDEFNLGACDNKDSETVEATTQDICDKEKLSEKSAVLSSTNCTNANETVSAEAKTEGCEKCLQSEMEEIQSAAKASQTESSEKSKNSSEAPKTQDKENAKCVPVRLRHSKRKAARDTNKKLRTKSFTIKKRKCKLSVDGERASRISHLKSKLRRLRRTLSTQDVSSRSTRVEGLALRARAVKRRK